MITIVDYSSGNANSILRALKSIGAEARFSRDRHDIAESDFIILPGVGHAGAAKASLEREGLLGTLEDAVLTRKVPVMGICLGMQLAVVEFARNVCGFAGMSPTLPTTIRSHC